MAVDEFGNIIPDTEVEPIEGMLTPSPTLEETTAALGTEAGLAREAITAQPVTIAVPYAEPVDETAGERTMREAGIRAGEEFYEPERGTVAGQLEALLSKESPWLKQAETRAKLETQRRGVLGSSMEAGAREAARIKAALPIAQADAAAYQRLREEEQRQTGAAAQIGVEETVAARLKAFGADLASEQQKFSTTMDVMVKEFDYTATNINQEFLQGVGAEHELQLGTALSGIDADIKTRLAAQQIDATTAAAMRNQASTYLQNHQIAIETLLSNESFTSLGAEAISSTFNNLLLQTTGAMNFARDSIDWVATEGSTWTDQLVADLEFTAEIEAPLEPIIEV